MWDLTNVYFRLRRLCVSHFAVSGSGSRGKTALHRALTWEMTSLFLNIRMRIISRYNDDVIFSNKCAQLDPFVRKF